MVCLQSAGFYLSANRTIGTHTREFGRSDTLRAQAPGSQELIYPSCQLAGEKRIWIIAIIDFQVVARTVVDRVEGDLEVKVDVRIAGL